MHYTLSEDSEDYNSAEGIAKADSSFDIDNNGENDALTGALDADVNKNASGKIDSVYTGFTNTKEGVIPTGVILSVAPWVIAGIVIIAGVVFFAIRSRKKYEE